MLNVIVGVAVVALAATCFALMLALFRARLRNESLVEAYSMSEAERHSLAVLHRLESDSARRLEGIAFSAMDVASSQQRSIAAMTLTHEMLLDRIAALEFDQGAVFLTAAGIEASHG